MTPDQQKFHAAAVAACAKFNRRPLAMLESASAGQDSGWMDFPIQRWSLIYSGEADYDLHREMDPTGEDLGDILCFAEARCTSVDGMVQEIESSDNAKAFWPAPAGGDTREGGSK